MQLVPNTRVGSYEVVGLLGVGGMGEVYRARDTRLNRDVALKILPESFALDPDRVARFRREAQVLASLNHPNIAAIYGIEESNGIRALVLELVEGPTLADRIAQGALPLDEALPNAQQIVAALEVAHELGIIHRDLKPANIKVRPDGTVKVLDFGLAKALEPAAGAAQAPSLTESPTITTPAMTLAGVILGTAAYMSPEQARGRPADRRSDVWAFGCVLYEMLTGKQAFAGADVSDMLAAVLRSEPDWSAVPPSVPPMLLVFLKRCLRKEPKQRIPDIGTIRLALDGSFDLDVQRSPAATRPPAGSPWRRAVPWIVALLLAGLTVGLVVYDLRPVPPAHVSRLVIPTPPEAPVVGALASQVAISRDGSRVVYRTQREKANEADSILYVHDVGTLDVRLLPGTEGAAQPFFSPDDESVAYFDLRDRRLKRIGVRGGNPTTVCRWNGGQFSGGSWGSDDHIVFGTADQGLQRVAAVGGEPKALTMPDTAKGASPRWPEVLPNSAAVLFTVWYGTDERSHIAVLSVATGQVSEIAAGGTHPRFANSGHLVYVAGGTLRAVGFDPVRLAVRGSSVPVQEGVNEGPTGAAQFALAENGSLVYARRGSPIVGQRTLVWVDRRGREEPVNLPARAYTYFRLSPDGTRVALDARDQENDIWIGHLLDGRLMRLTLDPGLNRTPIWTRDGTRVAFTSNRDGAEGISWQAADGSGSAERLSPPGTEQGPLSFSRDGTRLVFITPLDGSQEDIGAMTLTGERRTEMLLNTRYMETNGEVSPDGDWLAFQSDESSENEIYVRPFPDVKTRRWQISTGGGTRPLWSRDGRELFYFVPPNTIMAVPVEAGKELRFGKPAVVLKGTFTLPGYSGRHYDVSLDGRRFLLLKEVQDKNAPETSPQLVLVQHWAEELKRLVPSK